MCKHNCTCDTKPITSDTTCLDTQKSIVTRRLEVKETTEEYNGWTNYATWRVNLEIVNADSFDGQEFGNLQALADAIKDQSEEFIEERRGSLNLGGYDEVSTDIAVDFALAFMSDVNWYEIAEGVADCYPSVIKA